ncbi:DUF3823 domain-containing protein [Chitinophaga agrisoli]|uniref:DUF3823 domain-containing protein n=1 Tax=Chitinophaga agrisoli TaxID=2607653 RepID=A0A5B2VL74_9BACT|nr:DUF3823 domain-containing protein [Chitinophaga agrisoli]KAA2238929.1 DUF3823 domain-containing protein [Chitinophaga agrisoli]
MKKNILYTILSCMALLSFSACSKEDNYTAPAETLTGRIIDLSTGQPIQTESGGIRLRAEEQSWNNGAGVIPQYFNVKYDGTFNNSKVFKGKFKLYPMDGAFVPLVTTTAPIVDNSKVVDIQGVTNVEFQVEPFLKVEWIGEPVVNPDKTITIQCKFTRGTTNPAYQFNVTDVFLYVSTTEFVSNASYDNRFSNQVKYNGAEGNNVLGQTVTITTKGTLGGNRPYYIRVGARTADNVNKRYNYNVAKQVNIPGA